MTEWWRPCGSYHTRRLRRRGAPTGGAVLAWPGRAGTDDTARGPGGAMLGRGPLAQAAVPARARRSVGSSWRGVTEAARQLCGMTAGQVLRCARTHCSSWSAAAWSPSSARSAARLVAEGVGVVPAEHPARAGQGVVVQLSGGGVLTTQRPHRQQRMAQLLAQFLRGAHRGQSQPRAPQPSRKRQLPIPTLPVHQQLRRTLGGRVVCELPCRGDRAVSGRTPL